MALDIHDWGEGGKRGQVAKEALVGKEESEAGVGDIMGSSKGNDAEEMDAENSEDVGVCVNDNIEEYILKDNVGDIFDRKQAVLIRNPGKKGLGSDYNENHEKNEANHAQAGIEQGPVHEGEVSGNLKAKVNFNTAEECCSQDEVESLNNKGTMEHHLDEVEGNVEMVDAELGTTRTQAQESPSLPKILFKQLYENGGSVVWAECPEVSWFPAILPKLSASNIASSISYILPFPAKAASNLVQLFDAEGSWKRVEVVQPLGEDREVDEERLRMEGLVF